MSISNDCLTELVMQDIISTNSAKTTQPSFNTLFNIETIADFYLISSSSFLACHHCKKRKNFGIKDNTSQLQDALALGQKWEILRYVKFKEPHWM